MNSDDDDVEPMFSNWISLPETSNNLKFIFKFSEIHLILPYIIIYLTDKNKPKEIYFEIYWFIFSMILKSIGLSKSKGKMNQEEEKELKLKQNILSTQRRN